jgi:hypothetical protein
VCKPFFPKSNQRSRCGGNPTMNKAAQCRDYHDEPRPYSGATIKEPITQVGKLALQKVVKQSRPKQSKNRTTDSQSAVLSWTDLAYDQGPESYCHRVDGKRQKTWCSREHISNTGATTMNDDFGTMRKQRPLPQDQQPLGSMPKELGGGPRAVDISKPDTRSILKKLKAIDRDGAKKYRQQGGQ